MEVDAEGGELCHLEDTATNDVHRALRFFCVRGKMMRANGPSPSTGCPYSIAITVKRPCPVTSFVLNAARQTTATKMGRATNSILIDPLAFLRAHAVLYSALTS
jgi:hypothetical protein